MSKTIWHYASMETFLAILEYKTLRFSKAFRWADLTPLNQHTVGYVTKGLIMKYNKIIYRASCRNYNNQVSQDFSMTSNSNHLSSKFILEPAIDPLHIGSFIVPDIC